MKYLFASAMLLAAGLAAPASAQSSAQATAQGNDDLRINQLIIYGEDACPQSTDNEIVICARRPENDRFRIPENLRDNPNAPANLPWGVRAEELVYLGRTGIGSCSAAGAGGDTGCLLKLIDQARAERANRDDVNWTVLIEQARQERLARIDAESEAIEQELRERGE